MEIKLKIEFMNKGQWGKVRAFFSVRTEEGFIIKGLKLIEGINPFESILKKVSKKNN